MTTTEILKMCTTVEQIEGLMCHDCSKSGHWGWCDAPWINCEYRDRIKEILGITGFMQHTLNDTLKRDFYLAYRQIV